MTAMRGLLLVGALGLVPQQRGTLSHRRDDDSARRKFDVNARLYRHILHAKSGIIVTVSASCRTDVVDAVIEVCGIEAPILVDDANLETLGIDSLDLIEIGMLIEERHDVEIDSDDFGDVVTFGDAIAVFDRIIAA